MRFTSRGLGLAIAGFVMVAVGFQFGYPELAALGTSAWVAVLGAVAFVGWRPRLSVRRGLAPDRVTRDEVCQASLRIANASRFFGASLVARDRLRPGGWVPVPLVRLRPGRVSGVCYAVPTSRRGVIDVGPVEIVRRDPLGLVGVVRRYGEGSRVWVRPRVHPIAAVPVGLSRSMDGRVDRVPQGSITFSALRSYVVGDDLRHVHWRTSARVGELMVREHVDTSLPRIVILLDDRATAHALGAGRESTFEAACEAAASLLLAAVHEDVYVELRLVSGREAAATHLGADALLDLLAEAVLVDSDSDIDGESDKGIDSAGADSARAGGPEQAGLHTAVQRLRVRRPGDTLIYLTGPPNEDDLGTVAGLRGVYPSIIAGVFGSVDGGLATAAGMLLVGAVDGADFAAAWDGVRAW